MFQRMAPYHGHMGSRFSGLLKEKKRHGIERRYAGAVLRD